MDNFMNYVRLELEKILSEEETNILKTKINEKSQKTREISDEAIITMIGDIYNDKYAQHIDDAERNILNYFSNLKDADENGMGRTWELAKKKDDVEKRILNSFYIENDYPEEFKLILLIDMVNGLARHVREEQNVTALYAIKDELLKELLSRFPAKNVCVMKSDDGVAKRVLYFKIKINDEDMFFSWHSADEGIPITENLQKKPMYRELYEHLRNDLTSRRDQRTLTEERNMAEDEHRAMRFDRVGRFYNAIQIGELLELDGSEKVIKDSFDEIRENKNQEDRKLQIDEKIKEPKKINDIQQEVLNVFLDINSSEGELVEFLDKYDFSKLENVKGIDDNIKNIFRLISTKSFDDKQSKMLMIAFAMGEIIKNNKFRSNELLEIYNKIIENLADFGRVIEPYGKGRKIYTLTVCVDAKGNMQTDKFAYFKDGKWKIIDKNSIDYSDDYDIVKLNMYQKEENGRATFVNTRENIERIKALGLSEIEDFLMQMPDAVIEENIVYEGMGSYEDDAEIIIPHESLEEAVNIDEGVTNEEDIEEIVAIDEVAEETASIENVEERIEEVDDLKPAGDIEAFLEDPDVQERTKKAILSMSQEDKIEMLKYIASTLTPQEKFKFLGELLQEFAPGSNSHNPPKKRGRPKGSKNRGVTK